LNENKKTQTYMIKLFKYINKIFLNFALKKNSLFKKIKNTLQKKEGVFDNT